MQRKDFANYWKVENRELINSGDGPYATSDLEYGNIELLAEYKIAAGADSGIYLRGCPQIQIWDYTQKPMGAKHKPFLGSGGLYNNIINTKDPLILADKPIGQWNSFRIKQIGSNTSVWLNDKLVVDNIEMENYWDRSKPLPKKGPIMLQTFGKETRWRNIMVREID